MRVVGLPEGLLGTSEISAETLEEAFENYPDLSEIQTKLTLDGDILRGFAPCDG